MADKAPTRLKHVAESTRDMFVLDPRKIQVEPGFNTRDFSLKENVDHVHELRDSMLANGQKVPVEVRYERGEVWLVKGESRWRAAMLIVESGEDFKLLAVQEQIGTSEADRTIDLVIENNTGKPLTPLEQAAAYKRLISFNWTVEQIAKKANRSKATVEDLLRLHGASNTVHQLIRDGRISATQAIDVCRDKGISKADGILQRAAERAEKKGNKKAGTNDVRSEAGMTQRYSQKEAQIMRGALEKLADGQIDPVGFALAALIELGYRQRAAAA